MARIMAGNRCVSALQKIIKSKNISRSLKIRMYQTMIRPIVLYACETWTFNATESSRLEIWERKIPRKIFGGKKIDNIWTRRTNEELKQLYRAPSITGVARAQRLRWLGHIERMAEARIPSMIMKREIGGKRRRGRPRIRWKKDVEEDLRRIRVDGWRIKAKDRNKWRKITNQAMSLLGFWSY